MENERSFIDELLAEAEVEEKQLEKAHYDLILIEISKLQNKIADTFAQADQEMEIIKQWSLQANAKLQTKIEYYELKLEAFIKQEGVKTIELPNGILKMHRKPDKVEITDIDAFLKNAKAELVKIIPEQVKPDLNKIKAYVKQHKVIPDGLTFTKGKQEFTYKLNERKDDQYGYTKQIGTTFKPAIDIRTNV